MGHPTWLAWNIPARGAVRGLRGQRNSICAPAVHPAALPGSRSVFIFRAPARLLSPPWGMQTPHAQRAGHHASHPPSMALAARATKPHPLGRPSFPSSPCNYLESRRSSALPTLESVVSHSRHAIGKARAPSAPRRAAEAHGLVNANFSSERAPRRTHEPRPFEAPEPRGQDGVKPMTRVDHCGAHCATPAAAVEQTATPTAATSCTATAAGTVSPGAWAIGVALSFAGRGAAADRNGRGPPSNLERWGGSHVSKGTWRR